MNILIMKSYGIGNVLMATPMMKALYENGHKVYLLYDAGPLGGPTGKLLEGAEYIEEMRGFDLVKERNGDPIISWVLEKKIDIGVQSFPGDSLWNWLYDYCQFEIRYAISKPEEYTQHETDYNLDSVRDLIKEDNEILYSMPIQPLAEKERKQLQKWIPKHKRKKLITLCTSYKKEGRWQMKNWGVGNFAVLAKYLIDEGYSVALIDGADGANVCNTIKFMEPRVINLCGITSLNQTKHVLRMAVATIANDCGPGHMSAATGTTTLSLFGPTSVTKNQPLGEDVIVLKSNIDHDKHSPGELLDGCACLTSISPTLVMKVLNNYAFNKKEVTCGSSPDVCPA
jgi:ADP-heptose:LPS heptosyltransferase